MTQETPMASVFAQGRYVGAILHRGPKGFEAIGEDNTSHGFFNSQREAAAALQAISLQAPADWQQQKRRYGTGAVPEGSIACVEAATIGRLAG
jgi:hypothetical protein